MNPAMVDWNAGNYERTADELEPVARAVVEQAEPLSGERVLDLACGTGNAALLATSRGARVVGVDSAPRLLSVARERARRLARTPISGRGTCSSYRLTTPSSTSFYRCSG
jgi:ubiquinone/menaquinone biosynthesis C-methylase UbiE